MQQFVAYYRVSTQRQGTSGLGLEAQKTAVQRFVNYNTEAILQEFTDIESGKNDDRIELCKAIELAKKENVHLVIAKLDRLSRNAGFIFMLRDSKVEFTCVDMPNANSVTIGIMAVLAQDERERISQRTKAALDELRRKGVQLGKPENLTIAAVDKGRSRRVYNSLHNEHNVRAAALIESLRKEGKTFYQITGLLNDLGFKTRRGCRFTQTQVQRLFDKFGCITKNKNEEPIVAITTK